MGGGGSKPEEPEPLPCDEDAQKLVLVKKGSLGAVVFEPAETLAKGDAFVPLTLKGGGAIVLRESPGTKVCMGGTSSCTPRASAHQRWPCGHASTQRAAI